MAPEDLKWYRYFDRQGKNLKRVPLGRRCLPRLPNHLSPPRHYRRAYQTDSPVRTRT